MRFGASTLKQLKRPFWIDSATVEHRSVLLKETVDFLSVREGGFYLDATLGGGGHASAILERGGCVLGIERDPQALTVAQSRVGKNVCFQAVLGNFKNLKELSHSSGYKVFDGIVFDLGLSSFQLKTPGRGFSYSLSEPLDMRASPDLTLTAADIVNGFTKDRLYEIFIKFGEERLSSRLADLIEKRRVLNKIESTGDLYEIIGSLAPKEEDRRKIASRVFQALRIYLNNELDNLKEALPRALEMLRIGGSLVVISFHSIEDRLVKNFFVERARVGKGMILTKRPVRPQVIELRRNPSSRSARLRALKKI